MTLITCTYHVFELGRLNQTCFAIYPVECDTHFAGSSRRTGETQD
jgi:hypothetical protein